MKDLCGLQYCLGIEISRNNQGITLNHHKYTLKLITETGLAGTRPSKTPMEMNSKLTSVEFDSFLGNNKSDWLLDNPTSYKRLIGKLLYLTVTRPNISFSFQQLRQFMHKPKESHMSVVFRVVKYVNNQPGLGLNFLEELNLQLRVYYDSDWAGCHETRKFITGFCIKWENH